MQCPPHSFLVIFYVYFILYQTSNDEGAEAHMLQSKKLIQHVHHLQFECRERGRIVEHENKEKPLQRPRPAAYTHI